MKKIIGLISHLNGKHKGTNQYTKFSKKDGNQAQTFC